MICNVKISKRQELSGLNWFREQALKLQLNSGVLWPDKSYVIHHHNPLRCDVENEADAVDMLKIKLRVKICKQGKREGIVSGG